MNDYQRGHRDAILKVADRFYLEGQKLHGVLDALIDGPLKGTWLTTPLQTELINRNRANANQLIKDGDTITAMAQSPEKVRDPGVRERA